MKGIILKDFEVRRLASAGSVLIWRRVKSQPTVPPGGFLRKYGPGEGHDGEMFMAINYIDGHYHPWDGIQYKCPLGSTGETRFVKEKWAPDMYDRRGGVVIYKCNGTHIVKWKPSTTMPSWASRFRVTLTVSCRQIQSVTEEEAVRSGCRDAVGNWKPRLQACFYERNAFSQIMGRVSPGSWERNEWQWAINLEVKK